GLLPLTAGAEPFHAGDEAAVAVYEIVPIDDDGLGSALFISGEGGGMPDVGLADLVFDGRRPGAMHGPGKLPVLESRAWLFAAFVQARDAGLLLAHFEFVQGSVDPLVQTHLP